MLEADDINAARSQEKALQDERVAQYWDSKRALGRLISRSLNLSIPVAWDIYLLYSSGTIWKSEEMPVPDFWAHQLDERPDLYLDPARLMSEIQRAIDLQNQARAV
jgi:hypothetical protein